MFLYKGEMGYIACIFYDCPPRKHVAVKVVDLEDMCEKLSYSWRACENFGHWHKNKTCNIYGFGLRST